jgi:hypothetical protein
MHMHAVQLLVVFTHTRAAAGLTLVLSPKQVNLTQSTELQQRHLCYSQSHLHTCWHLNASICTLLASFGTLHQQQLVRHTATRQQITC